jgi:hypothetical protein
VDLANVARTCFEPPFRRQVLMFAFCPLKLASTTAFCLARNSHDVLKIKGFI